MIASEISVKPITLSKLMGQLWKQLKPRRRIQIILLVGLMVLASFAEVATLGAVVPFLGSI